MASGPKVLPRTAPREGNEALRGVRAVRCQPEPSDRREYNPRLSVNKRELVAGVARTTGLPAADVARVVDAALAAIAKAVTKGDRVILARFGTFHRQARAARTARDISADRPLAVPATRVPAFRPGKPFREAVAGSAIRRRRRSATRPRRTGMQA
jgi:DNA-binding protein HU-beta